MVIYRSRKENYTNVIRPILNITLFAVAIFSLSCNNYKELEVQSYEKEKILSSLEIFKGDKKGISIFIVDTLILLGLPKSEDSLYAVYGLKSNQYLGALIKKGLGMEEFSSSLFYGQHQSESDGIKIWITDFTTMEMSLINVTSSLEKQKTIVEKRISIVNKKIPEATFLFYIKKDKIVGYHNIVNRDQAIEERVFLLNSSSVDFKEVPTIPTRGGTDVNFLNRIYSGIAKLKPDGSLIVNMQRYQPKVNIIDNEGNFISSFILEKNYPKVFEKKGLETRTYKAYNRWVDVSDNYIYLLRENTSTKQLHNKKGEMTISVIDWKGISIKNMVVSDHIMSFAVDEKNKTIYGLAPKEKKVFKYYF